MASAPGFWSREGQSKTLKELSSLKEKKDEWNKLGGLYQEIVTLGELLREEEDKDLNKEMETKLLLLERKIGKLEIESLLRGKMTMLTLLYLFILEPEELIPVIGRRFYLECTWAGRKKRVIKEDWLNISQVKKQE